jgi:pyroglutamyl-peptidase
MRLLIYGFGPYREFRDNITEKILDKFSERKGLKKIVFPVRFHKGQFVNAVQKHKPDIILGLGQCSRGQRLRIESRAKNSKRRDPKEKSSPIIAGGPQSFRTNLKLALNGESSDNAGEYVCNYSMYVMLHFIKRHRLPIRYGFVHIPYRYDYKRAVRLLDKAVGKLQHSR